MSMPMIKLLALVVATSAFNTNVKPDLRLPSNTNVQTSAFNTNFKLSKLKMVAVLNKPSLLESIELTHPSGSSATVYTHGACVTSFKMDGAEHLAFRTDAKLDGSKPISGGIPICWPQFGPGPIQQHGFARNVEWDVIEKTREKLVLSLEPSEYTQAMWDKDFKLLYIVTLMEDRLLTNFKVMNPGSEAFDFTTALHSYFDVSSIANLEIVGGFGGASCLDRTTDPMTPIATSSDTVVISDWVDRLYTGVTGELVLKDSGKDTELLISSSGGWSDTVIWNPFGDDTVGADGFVCVEAAKTPQAVTLPSGETWEANMHLIPRARASLP